MSFPALSRRLVPCALVASLVACGSGADPAPEDGHAHDAPPAVTNRISIPADVVANLGITFETAKRGRLETRVGIPGRIEVAPDARYPLRAPAAGRLRLSTARWKRVAAGEVLAELAAPELRAAVAAVAGAANAASQAALDQTRLAAEDAPTRALARALAESLSAAGARLAAAEGARATAARLEADAAARLARTQALTGADGVTASQTFVVQRDHLDAQVAALEAGARLDEARTAAAELAVRAATARARSETLAEEQAILARRRAAAEAALAQEVRGLAALTGNAPEDLVREVGGQPAWLGLSAVPLRAPAAGVVVEVSAREGEWIEAGGVVLRIVDPERLVFRGEVPESDGAGLPPDAEARIEVPAARGGPFTARLPASLALANPVARTLLVEMAMPPGTVGIPDGASATAHVLVTRSAQEEVLVPTACLVEDDLEWLVFRRDPANADQVIRTPVALGARSDGWVEVLAEVAEGDELVRDGIHQLRLAGTGKALGKGHFHADGTWHDADH